MLFYLLFTVQRSYGLSFEDCSVWYYTQKLSGTLLTGDGKLRKQVSKQGIKVRGILYVFDELVERKLLEIPIALEKINKLRRLNNRLPKNEIEKRIKHWNEENNVG